MGKMNWDKARRRDLVRTSGVTRKPTRKQLDYLTILRERAGLSGLPKPSSMGEASQEIELLKRPRM